MTKAKNVIPSSSDDVLQMKLSYITGGNAKQHQHSEK
jgi:hypothetical protein